jgi:hypothetical protein
LVSIFRHPEPGPELASESNDFGISLLVLKNLGFKALPCRRGSLFHFVLQALCFGRLLR